MNATASKTVTICSLVLATLGRDRELEVFLESLKAQTCRDFELIVIDQNRDGRIDSILCAYEGWFPIRHIKVDFTGNARARDYGIAFARGSVVAFPDDDCAYESDVLERVMAAFSEHAELGILCAGCYDFGKTDFSIGVNPAKAGPFSRFSMVGVEFTHFFHLQRLDNKEFHLDHDFGIGSKYSGGEGFELLYRLLRAGGIGYYDPAIRICHANKDSYQVGADRMLKYSSGVGAYIRKFANERDAAMLYFIARKMFIVPVLKLFIAALSLNPGRIRYSYNNLVGVWHGFMAYQPAGETEGNSHA